MPVAPLSIDPGSSTPPFEQLRLRLLEQIGSGELVPGTRLPTVRQLAEELGIAANTVARAYRELEAAGAVQTRGRNGTVVALSAGGPDREAERAARTFADRMNALGVDPERALALAAAALAD